MLGTVERDGWRSSNANSSLPPAGHHRSGMDCDADTSELSASLPFAPPSIRRRHAIWLVFDSEPAAGHEATRTAYASTCEEQHLQDGSREIEAEYKAHHDSSNGLDA